MEELVELFQPIDEATTILSGENYSTFGLLHMILNRVMKKTAVFITDPVRSAECRSIGEVLDVVGLSSFCFRRFSRK